MSYTNYAVANLAKKQQKDVEAAILKGEAGYELYVESIKRETPKAYLLSLETQDNFKARTLDGHEAEFAVPPLEFWIAKSLLEGDVVKDQELKAISWKLASINMEFIKLMAAVIQVNG